MKKIHIWKEIVPVLFTKLFSHRERYSHSCVLTRTFTQVVSFNFPVQLFSAKITDILQYIACFISNAWQDISVFVCSRSMHTATNYYLFSLAVADLLTLLLGESHNKLLKMIFVNTIVCVLLPKLYLLSHVYTALRLKTWTLAAKV